MSRSRTRDAVRVTWTIVSILIVQTLVCGLALVPVAAVWERLLSWTESATVLRVALLSAAAAPSYVIFSLALMFVSALVTRVLGLRTPGHAEMRLADLDWALLRWVEYMAAIHVVRVVAGRLARGTPVWTAYLRLCGARLGRRVYVNSLGLSDYNLLEFGDDVVIGADAHVSGHTVERGVVKTAPVRLGTGVTIGVGSVVDIGVVAGDFCQVGALSFVPKHAVLNARTTYVGIPVGPVAGG
jgi:acetyltransferase-like isoleucine patch superfamily enzyme